MSIRNWYNIFKRYRDVWEKLSKTDDIIRAFLFYRMEQTWCFDCGESWKTHPIECKSPLVVEPEMRESEKDN